jgi:hypothetical protein
MNTSRWILVLVLGAVVLTQFNNCGSVSSPETGLTETLSISCDEDCVTATADNLESKPNLVDGAEYKVAADVIEFNIAGECNEGGFPLNTIRWELQRNGVSVRNSGMLGMVSGNPTATAHSRCVNGRFLIYVNLNAIAEDPINRSGLKVNAQGARSSYELLIEITGQRSNTSREERNNIRGRSRVVLSAI